MVEKVLVIISIGFGCLFIGTSIGLFAGYTNIYSVEYDECNASCTKIGSCNNGNDQLYCKNNAGEINVICPYVINNNIINPTWEKDTQKTISFGKIISQGKLVCNWKSIYVYLMDIYVYNYNWLLPTAITLLVIGLVLNLIPICVYVSRKYLKNRNNITPVDNNDNVVEFNKV